ncbi:MAG: polyphosphate kinase 2 family protein [Planctomycetes bacterium]|nr:polyphosphate kinase 2 family protein [Planctomycetota bacterium]
MNDLNPVPPGRRLRLAGIDPDDTGGLRGKEEGERLLAKHLKRLEELQEVFYAEGKHTLLLVFQAMDAAGKDGAIRRVVGAVNPAGVRITSFKAPTKDELAHDFLWRIHREVPGRGMIGVFNRSHYEDVLIVRVHRWITEKVCRRRYGHIRDFEELLAENGVTILKFFLHISKKEQKERLEARRDDPAKRWKFNPDDLKERALWGDYQRAYEDAITETSRGHAPWYVIPSNHKWYRDIAISRIIARTMARLDSKYPPAPKGIERIRVPS